MGSSVPPFSPAGAWLQDDIGWMRRALALAVRAGEAQEIPVGAVLVSQGKAAGEGWNRPIDSCDPTSHAEIEAIRQAATVLGNYRLPGSTLYVTLEPCVMCVGAILAARINRVVFAARDLRFGALRSKFRLGDSELLNHQVQIEEGLLATECAALLTGFFKSRRAEDSAGRG